MRSRKFLLLIFFLFFLSYTLQGTSPASLSLSLQESIKKGRWERATRIAHTIIKKYPTAPFSASAYLWLGLYYKSRYDYQRSIQYYQKLTQLFPDTWSSAETYARIGCNYYILNDYSRAYQFFSEAGKKATDWKQRKYASTWAKWVRKALLKPEGSLTCAGKAVKYYLRLKGRKWNEEKLKKLLASREGLTSLSRVIQFLHEEGMDTRGVYLPFSEIKKELLPLLAVVKGEHLVVVEKIEGERIILYDPARGKIPYYERELEAIWEGKVIGEKKLSRYALLSRKELETTQVGTCYCCPELPITSSGDDPDCDGSTCCNREEAEISGGDCSTCGATGYGAPRISVDTASLALLVRDIPIGYKSKVGPDMEIYMVFNSDLPHSGLFGNGWHSILETRITENPDGSVTVRRSGGHDDTFTFSGGEYHPPVGRTDRLVKNQDGTFTLEFIKSGKKYHYDTSSRGGKLLRIEDRNGNTLTIDYDAEGNPISITDAVGRITQIETDSQGRVIRITDPLGRYAAFTYDNTGNLVEVRDMGGRIYTYTYDGNQNIISLTGPHGTYNFEYGQWGPEIWISRITDPQGNQYEIGGEFETYVRDPRGNYTSFQADWLWSWPYYGDTIYKKDAQGNTVKYTYNENRYRTQIQDKRGNITRYTYDERGNLTSRTDPLGNTWVYTYDEKNLLASVTDPEGNTTRYEYDTRGNLTRLIHPDGSTYTYTYDERGLRTSVTDPEGNTTTYEYDDYGNLIKITTPEGGIITFTYDILGRKLSQTDSLGRTTYYNYDDLNRVTRITHPDGTYREYIYDCCNLRKVIDENGNTTTYEYNPMGKLIRVTDALGNTTTYTYDAVGNLTSLTDANGNTTTYEYDSLNRLMRITYPDGKSESYQYDAEGNLIQKTKCDGTIITYQYDPLNRLTRINYPDHQVTYAYDSRGNRISLTDNRGTTTYEYDSLNRLIRITYPDGKTIDYTYDGRGNRTSIRYPSGKTVTYTYDMGNRLTQVTDGDKVTRYEYNVGGNLLRITYPNGTYTTYHYNSRNWPDRITHNLPGEEITYIYTYDSTGNIIQIEEGNKTKTYTYDPTYQLIEEKVEGDGGYTINYQYDSTGNRIEWKKIEEGKEHQEKKKDSFNRENIGGDWEKVGGRWEIIAWTILQGRSIIIPLPLSGKKKRVGRRIKYQTARIIYGEEIGEAEKIEVRADVWGTKSGIIMGWEEGRWYEIGKEFKVERSGRWWIIRTEYYLKKYDRGIKEELARVYYPWYYFWLYPEMEVRWEGGELILSVEGREVMRYGMEIPSGNAGFFTENIAYFDDFHLTYTWREPGKEEIRTYEYNANNQLIKEIIDGDTTIIYSYDPNGNLVEEGDGQDTTFYTWNAEDKLISVTLPSGEMVEYEYDGEGRRIGRRDSSGTTHYLNDPNRSLVQVLAEYGDNGSIEKEYVYGMRLISMERGGESYYYHTDHLGSVRFLTGERGERTQSYDYDAFGNLLTPPSSFNTRLYTGEDWDGEVGLLYLRARYYKPEVGRFVSRDPVNKSDNLYIYVHNNPLRWTDPTGELDPLVTTIVTVTALTGGKALICYYTLAMNLHQSQKTVEFCRRLAEWCYKKGLYGSEYSVRYCEREMRNCGIEEIEKTCKEACLLPGTGGGGPPPGGGPKR